MISLSKREGTAASDDQACLLPAPLAGAFPRGIPALLAGDPRTSGTATRRWTWHPALYTSAYARQPAERGDAREPRQRPRHFRRRRGAMVGEPRGVLGRGRCGRRAAGGPRAL